VSDLPGSAAVTEIDVACAAARDGWACSVRVRENGESTEHEVTVRAAEASAHGVGSVDDAERLVSETFRFLLERESKSSILRTFDLDVVRRYFPEYEREIHRRIGP
jgi:hypothetical protein